MCKYLMQMWHQKTAVYFTSLTSSALTSPSRLILIMNCQMARYSTVEKDRKANLLLAAQGDVPSMIVTYPTCTIANGINANWETGSEEMCGPFKG